MQIIDITAFFTYIGSSGRIWGINQAGQEQEETLYGGKTLSVADNEPILVHVYD